MIWLFVIASVLSAWALLRLLGAERQRRLEALHWQLAAEAADEPDDAQAASGTAMGPPDISGTADRPVPQPHHGAERA